MSSKWPSIRLGDYIDTSLGKMLDVQKNRGAPQPYLGNSNVRWGQFDLSDLAQMKFEQHEAERYGIRKGDLIICEGGEPGRCAIWNEELPEMKIQKALHRVRVKNGLNSNYLFYWFMQAGRVGLLESHFTGTTIKHLTGKALVELRLPLPSQEEQLFIAKTLGALDDRIQNLRQINTSLQAIAATLYESWFVNFDGVKQEDMQDSELGLIPKGWKVTTLGDSATVSSGKRPENRSLQPTEETAVKVWGGNGPIAFTTMPLIKEPILLTGRVGTLGSVFRISEPCWPSDNTIFLSGCRTATFNYLFFQLLRMDLNSLNRGSTQPLLTQTDLKSQRIIEPPEKVLSQFDSIVEPLFRKLDHALAQIHILCTLRDTLLPRLISGRIREKL